MLLVRNQISRQPLISLAVRRMILDHLLRELLGLLRLQPRLQELRQLHFIVALTINRRGNLLVPAARLTRLTARRNPGLARPARLQPLPRLGRLHNAWLHSAGLLTNLTLLTRPNRLSRLLGDGDATSQDHSC
jgi:hypothetical protein